MKQIVNVVSNESLKNGSIVFGFTLAIVLILSSSVYADEVKTIFVGPQLVDCVGVGTQKCMQVREDENSEWKNFYNSIEGFTFAEGNSYKLSVKITDIENPPADSSSKKYELIEIIEKKSFSRHIPYKNACAPGFVPLDGICVLNDRCGPGAYPGKICTMDGTTQPYLRPLQQGNAGISAGNVICAESLELVFKSRDGSPACVSSHTAMKLKERGWQASMPVIACTLEYAPVCGINEKTYGNMCMLNADHVAIKHTGECKTEIVPTESELAKKLDQVQNKISSISKDIYNGMYNGIYSLDEASSILEKSKNELTVLLQQYQSLMPEQKIDRQIAMKFSTLGKMGFASVDSQINVIKNQIKNPLPEKSTEQIKQEIEKSFSIKYNSTRDVIKNYEESFEDGKYLGMMLDTNMKKGILQAQTHIFELYDDLENKKDLISEDLYQKISSEMPLLDESVQSMWLIINEHLEIPAVSSEALRYTWHAPEIDSEKGYFVSEIADGVYWLVSGGYQTMFVTTGEGVIVVDGPQPIGEKYISAINDITNEPVTHMIYSHHHQDHTGATGQIFPADITYISHKGTADVLATENDPNRPIPTEIFDGQVHTVIVGNKTIELHYLGDFHSNGDVLILLPDNKVAMLVDLLRPAESPYRAFGVTPDIELYLRTHDALQGFDFDVLISGHTGLLATKEHIKTNKQFTQSVMDNAQNALDSGDINPVETCTSTTIKQWDGKLGNLDAFMVDHCNAMIEYLQSK